MLHAIGGRRWARHPSMPPACNRHAIRGMRQTALMGSGHHHRRSSRRSSPPCTTCGTRTPSSCSASGRRCGASVTPPCHWRRLTGQQAAAVPSGARQCRQQDSAFPASRARGWSAPACAYGEGVSPPQLPPPAAASPYRAVLSAAHSLLSCQQTSQRSLQLWRASCWTSRARAPAKAAARTFAPA